MNYRILNNKISMVFPYDGFEGFGTVLMMRKGELLLSFNDYDITYWRYKIINKKFKYLSVNTTAFPNIKTGSNFLYICILFETDNELNRFIMEQSWV